MRQLLLATNNPGKVQEFRRLLAGIECELITPADAGIDTIQVEESGSSYAENASIKARAYAKAANILALADDSGLEVDALGGRPGLHSARYGGPSLDENGRNRLLLAELQSVAPAKRTARYRAVIAIADPAAGEVVCFEGVQEGAIALVCRGDSGFGYDPLFVVDGRRTQAEIPTAEKDEISHRGQACRLACGYLRNHL